MDWFTGAHVEAAGLELAVLLAEGAGLAEHVDAAVAAGRLLEPVLLTQPGAVAAGVEAAHPRHRRQRGVHRPARTASWAELVRPFVSSLVLFSPDDR